MKSSLKRDAVFFPPIVDFMSNSNLLLTYPTGSMKN